MALKNKIGENYMNYMKKFISLMIFCLSSLHANMDNIKIYLNAIDNKTDKDFRIWLDPSRTKPLDPNEQRFIDLPAHYKTSINEQITLPYASVSLSTFAGYFLITSQKSTTNTLQYPLLLLSIKSDLYLPNFGVSLDLEKTEYETAKLRLGQETISLSNKAVARGVTFTLNITLEGKDLEKSKITVSRDTVPSLKSLAMPAYVEKVKREAMEKLPLDLQAEFEEQFKH